MGFIADTSREILVKVISFIFIISIIVMLFAFFGEAILTWVVDKIKIESLYDKIIDNIFK